MHVDRCRNQVEGFFFTLPLYFKKFTKSQIFVRKNHLFHKDFKPHRTVVGEDDICSGFWKELKSWKRWFLRWFSIEFNFICETQKSKVHNCRFELLNKVWLPVLSALILSCNRSWPISEGQIITLSSKF